MLVKDFMKTDLITITADLKIVEAVELMKKNDIHRLPVVKGGQLIGLLTESTIQEAMPSKATSLSVYEMNYLINKTVAADIMVTDVITIGPEELLEDAILTMRQENVAVLPVVDKQSNLLGIITNNDIFDAFLDMTGYKKPGTRVAIEIEEDHTGVLADLTKIFAEEQLNIVQIVVYRQHTAPIIIIQLTHSDIKDVLSILTKANFKVISCVETTAK
ncbi:CBS and ACT domain-containing protein [Vagococcus silagei]|uniref:CBS domain-containing protein n=1 Tax=Vagococcus silagei TaxID=2508885 RepID=A0A4S3B5Y9_9ENTE|nr:CBS domain-containing protein [Vagococcus silagei]THB61988.1 CBS domain-containing protein [Vagococcus silagei]